LNPPSEAIGIQIEASGLTVSVLAGAGNKFEPLL
jgi:hypothetical protein